MMQDEIKRKLAELEKRITILEGGEIKPAPVKVKAKPIEVSAPKLGVTTDPFNPKSEGAPKATTTTEEVFKVAEEFDKEQTTVDDLPEALDKIHEKIAAGKEHLTKEELALLEENKKGKEEVDSLDKKPKCGKEGCKIKYPHAHGWAQDTISDDEKDVEAELVQNGEIEEEKPLDKKPLDIDPLDKHLKDEMLKEKYGDRVEEAKKLIAELDNDEE